MRFDVFELKNQYEATKCWKSTKVTDFNRNLITNIYMGGGHLVMGTTGAGDVKNLEVTGARAR